MHSPIDRERLITMADAGKYLAQRTGHRPYLCTLYRWALRGVSGRRLETVQVGRQRYTSVEAVQRFMHARDEQSVTVVSVQADRPTRVDSRQDVETLERRVFKKSAPKTAAH